MLLRLLLKTVYKLQMVYSYIFMHLLFYLVLYTRLTSVTCNSGMYLQIFEINEIIRNQGDFVEISEINRFLGDFEILYRIL